MTALNSVPIWQIVEKKYSVPIKGNIVRDPTSIAVLPNQESSVLYGGPTLNYGGQLSLYVPNMLRVNMTEDLAHLQLSDLQGETIPVCRTSDLQGERMLICRT